MKYTLLFSILIFVIFSLVPTINAENDLSFTIWVPDETLSNEIYHGIVFLESATTDVTFDLVTDNEEVVEIITKTITIPGGKHHGIFTIKTNGIGHAEIFAIYNDDLLQAEINVIQSAKTPTKIDLILPSELINIQSNEDEQTGYVFLINEFDNPVPSMESTMVTLTSNGDITLPKNSVIIEPGNHYAKFTFQIRGTGDITATASNLNPDDESISITQTDEIELHLAIAPDPIPTDSSAELFYWLERSGSPYLAPHDIDIRLSIDDSTKLSFDSSVRGTLILTPNTEAGPTTGALGREITTKTDAQLLQDSNRKSILEKGMHYGKIKVWSTADESSSLSISGLAESVSSNVSEKISISEILTTRTKLSSTDLATNTKIFAYPDPAYDKVEIIISSITQSGPVIEPYNEDITLFTDNKLKLPLFTSTINADTNYVTVIATVQDLGKSTIFAERHESKSIETDVELKEKYVRDPKLAIQPLPTIFDIEQDLFLITSSHDVITTNPELQNEGTLLSVTTKPHFTFESIVENESIITVKGIINNLSEDSEEDPKIFVASNAETLTETLDVHNPNRKTIIIMSPSSVFPNESFPLITHIADLDGNILQKDDLKMSSSTHLTLVEGLGHMNETGKQTLIFYNENTIPKTTSIIVKDATQSISNVKNTNSQISSETNNAITIFSYEVIVTNGEGSGSYSEGEEVTVSAEPVIDDIIIIKKKLVGWKNLPYTDHTFTLEIDDDIETSPIYEEDLTILFSITLPIIGIISLITIKKILKKKHNITTNNNENISDIDELFD